MLSVFRYISRSGNSHYACSTCQETEVTNAHAHQCENPDDELNVVDSVKADEDDTSNEVLLILNLHHCLDPVPETDRSQGHHRCQDVPILKRRGWEKKLVCFKLIQKTNTKGELICQPPDTFSGTFWC